MLQLFNCFFALCLRNWLSARVFFLPVWAKRMRSRAVSPPYNMCGHYCKRGPHAKNTCNEPISTNRSYRTGKKQTTWKKIFWIFIILFIQYYSTNCRHWDHSVGRHRAETRTRAGRPRGKPLPLDHHTSFLDHHTSLLDHHTSFIYHHTSLINGDGP